MQAQLAALVDLGQLDLDLVPDVEDVLDVLHALAADEPADLGDVEQAVLAGGQRDEGAEGRGLDHGAHEALADLGHLRVGDGVDGVAGRLGRGAVGGADVDGAVVLDRQVRAGVLLDLVNHLALGADDLTDLVHRDAHGQDTRGRGGHLVGGVDGLGQDVEDEQAGVAGLAERAGQHLGGQAVELGVQLEGRNEVTGSGDLEVHVPEGVLGAEDVGEGGPLGLAVDDLVHEAHGDTGHGRAQRHTGVEQGQGGGAHRAHGGRAVGAQGFGDLADRVGEVLAGGQDGHEGPLGQVAVADLAALGGAHAAGLTGGEGREVVVVHVALVGDRGEVVHLLLHAQHVEGGHAQDLGLAALEDGRAVHAGQDLDLGGQGADVLQAAPVHAHALGEGAVAHDLLGHGAEGGLEGLGVLLGGEGLGELGQDLVTHGVGGQVAGLLALGGDGGGQAVGLGGLLHGVVLLVGVVQVEGELGGGLRGVLGDLELGLAQGLDVGLGGLQALGDDGLGGGHGPGVDELPGVLGGAGLDHHDGDVAGLQDAAGHHHLEGGALLLGVTGEGHPVPVNEGQAGTGHGPGEGQAGDLGGHRGGVDGQDVVVVVGVDGQDGLNDLDLVAQALDEGGAQRTVDEAAGQDGGGSGAALAAEEGAGDAAGGVLALLDVHGQGEEVELVLGVLAHGGGGQDGGLTVEVGHGASSGLLGQAARLEAHHALAEGAVVDHCLGGGDLGVVNEHEVSFSRSSCRVRGLRSRPTEPSAAIRGSP